MEKERKKEIVRAVTTVIVITIAVAIIKQFSYVIASFVAVVGTLSVIIYVYITNKKARKFRHGIPPKP